ncbi:MAG TPA: alpha/beta fold hydrolase [Solirubrobacteraceae bacterium]|nr:alpha/beta fold hydrolase [Solirubrobacteraceae bacterium]
MSTERSAWLETADGVRLHALLADVPDPLAVLVLCHGLTTDRDEHGAFVAVRDRAVRAGIAVARFDFRAHGHSGGTNEQLRLAGARADADAVMTWLAAELDASVPVIPLGLSFGGAAAVHIATTAGPRCAALALWYAVVDYEYQYGEGSPVPLTRMMRGARGAADPEWSAMPVVGTDYHLPKGLIAELAGDATRSRLAALEVPVLAWLGSRDRFVGFEPLRELVATHPNITIRVAHGAAHGFVLWRPWVVRHTVAWAAGVAQAART